MDRNLIQIQRYPVRSTCGAVSSFSAPVLYRATKKDDGRSTVAGNEATYEFKRSFDGNMDTCSEITFPIRRDKRIHYELAFVVPPHPEGLHATSWSLKVMFVTRTSVMNTCLSPGLTVYTGTPENPDIYHVCPHDDSATKCLFRCAGYQVWENQPGHQPGTHLFVRMEVPVYGDWPMPAAVCEVESEWEPGKSQTEPSPKNWYIADIFIRDITAIFWKSLWFDFKQAGWKWYFMSWKSSFDVKTLWVRIYSLAMRPRNPCKTCHHISPTMWSRYMAANFHWKSHERHPISRQWERRMGCLCWLHSLIEVFYCCAVSYHIYDSDISTVYNVGKVTIDRPVFYCTKCNIVPNMYFFLWSACEKTKHRNEVNALIREAHSNRFRLNLLER